MSNLIPPISEWTTTGNEFSVSGNTITLTPSGIANGSVNQIISPSFSVSAGEYTFQATVDTANLITQGQDFLPKLAQGWFLTNGEQITYFLPSVQLYTFFTTFYIASGDWQVGIEFTDRLTGAGGGGTGFVTNSWDSGGGGGTAQSGYVLFYNPSLVISSPPTLPEEYNWLRYMPDTKLLDIAANNQQPLVVQQWAQSLLITRKRNVFSQLAYPNNNNKIDQSILVRQQSNPSYSTIVEQQQDLGEDNAPQLDQPYPSPYYGPQVL